jgi:small subunit ribosomal protein S6
MRDYEVVYIFKSSLTTDEIEGRLEGYHAKIFAVEGSEITAVEHWGKRQLAYPIDRNDNGYYVVTQFTASPTVLPDFERTLKLDEDLLRHLVVLSEGELPVPSSDNRLGDDRGDDERRGDKRRGDDDDDDDGKTDDDDDDGRADDDDDDDDDDGRADDDDHDTDGKD